MISTIILSIVIISIIIFTFIKSNKTNKEIYLGLFVGGMWALINILARSEEGLVMQLKAGTFAILFWFLYTTFMYKLADAYFKALLEITKTPPLGNSRAKK